MRVYWQVFNQFYEIDGLIKSRLFSGTDLPVGLKICSPIVFTTCKLRTGKIYTVYNIIGPIILMQMSIQFQLYKSVRIDELVSFET